MKESSTGKPGVFSMNRRQMTTLMVAAPVLVKNAVAEADFPDHPIKLIVPYGSGSGTDALARQLAVPVQRLLGQSMVVENRPGANAFIGAQVVAKSASDGYTLILATDHVMCYNPALFKKLPYNPTKDFSAVAGLTSHPHLLVVSPSVPARSVAELIALARKNPGALSFGSTGVGTAAHLVGEIFKQEAGIDILHVPYAGPGQLLPDLMSGRVSMLFYAYQAIKPFLDTGKLRVLANATERRADWLRDVPTLAELGYPRSVMAAWLAVYAPAETPTPRINKIAEAFREALKMPEISSQLNLMGIDIRYRSPSELTAYTISQQDQCRKIVEISGAKVE